MSFAVWFSTHKRSMLFLFFLLAAIGVVEAFKLPVTLFPKVDFPRVVVSIDCGDMPADKMQAQVARIAEEALRRVQNVKNIRSVTTRGSAEISISFNWGTDMSLATIQASEALMQIIPQLPKESQIQTKRMDPTSFPIISYSITSDRLNQAELYNLANYEIRPILYGVDGVAKIQIIGGDREEISVSLDEAKIAAYGLSIQDVADIIAKTNSITAVGKLQDGYNLYLAISNKELKSIEEIKNILIKTGSNGIIRLEEIASIQNGSEPKWIDVKADGKKAVLINVYQQPDANSVQMADEIKQKLSTIKIPNGVKISNWYDQSRLVVDSAASVRDAVLIGIALAALTLFIFLKNAKIMLIAVLIVPASLAITVALLALFHMSFNIMTLGGMAAAVGLIIDDAIVMIEQIVRRLKESSSKNHSGKIIEASIEFFKPLSASSASTVVIFAPLAFLDGVTGAFFKALSITMASALVISFLITYITIPILSDKFLTLKDAKEESDGRVSAFVKQKYEVIIKKLLLKPYLAILPTLIFITCGLFAYSKVGSGFMPSQDEGGFVLDYKTKPGTSLDETNIILQKIENILQNTPDVQTYSKRTGARLSGGVTEANEGDFFVKLKDSDRRAIEDVMDEIRAKIKREVAGVDVELAQLMEDMIGDLTAVPQPIEIKLFSSDSAKLQAQATEIAQNISKIKGVVDVKTGINIAGDTISIEIDDEKAKLEGVTPQDITNQLAAFVTGIVATQIQKNEKMIGVRVVPETKKDISSLQKLKIKAPDGHIFELRRVAKINIETGAAQITRENLKQMIAVTARISGADMGSVIKDVKTELSKIDLQSKGIYYKLGGLYEEQQKAFSGLIMVFAAALALVFVLLLFVYERFNVVFASLSAPLIAIFAVFIALFVSKVDLNISSMMGMTMVIGIVAETTIFYFLEAQLLNKEMPIEKALIEAGKNRIRPIAMTTLAAILTLLPLAFGIGQGSQMQQPLAIAIIGGLLAQMPLVLLITPTIFLWLQKIPHKN